MEGAATSTKWEVCQKGWEAKSDMVSEKCAWPPTETKGSEVIKGNESIPFAVFLSHDRAISFRTEAVRICSFSRGIADAPWRCVLLSCFLVSLWDDLALCKDSIARGCIKQ